MYVSLQSIYDILKLDLERQQIKKCFHPSNLFTKIVLFKYCWCLTTQFTIYIFSIRQYSISLTFIYLFIFQQIQYLENKLEIFSKNMHHRTQSNHENTGAISTFYKTKYIFIILFQYIFYLDHTNNCDQRIIFYALLNKLSSSHRHELYLYWCGRWWWT